MKLLTVLTIALLLPLQGEGIGSLPTAIYEPHDRPAQSGHKVKPGDDPYTNGDGVTVTNDEESSGNMTIDPADGVEGDVTKCKSKSGFDGSIANIDANDVVSLGSSNIADVSGTGGTVTVGGNSAVNVTNTTQPGAPGAESMWINLQGGTTLEVAPGSTVKVTT